jgi:predicted secreted protein
VSSAFDALRGAIIKRAATMVDITKEMEPFGRWRMQAQGCLSEGVACSSRSLRLSLPMMGL